MPKIIVKQIAIAGGGTVDGNEFQELYLDDKGRVWYQVAHWEYPKTWKSTGERDKNRKWVSEWKQLELPEEPNAKN